MIWLHGPLFKGLPRMAESRSQNLLGVHRTAQCGVGGKLPLPSSPSGAHGKRHAEAIVICVLLVLICGAFIPRAAAQNYGPASGDDDIFAHCRVIKSDARRLRCYEDASSSVSAHHADQGENVAGAWRLVRSPNPAGGREAVSIMHTADSAKSDSDFAGLMLRCGQKGDIEVLVALVQTFPPSSQPKVTTVAGQERSEFAAKIVPPGALILLPAEAVVFAEGLWQTKPHLSVEVEEENNIIRGYIPLEGLGAALRALRSSCPMP